MPLQGVLPPGPEALPWARGKPTSAGVEPRARQGALRPVPREPAPDPDSDGACCEEGRASCGGLQCSRGTRGCALPHQRAACKTQAEGAGGRKNAGRAGTKGREERLSQGKAPPLQIAPIPPHSPPAPGRRPRSPPRSAPAPTLIVPSIEKQSRAIVPIIHTLTRLKNERRGPPLPVPHTFSRVGVPGPLTALRAPPLRLSLSLSDFGSSA